MMANSQKNIEIKSVRLDMFKPIIGPPAGETKIKLPMQKTRTGI